MTTPVDIATKQLRLHGQDCVCDGCEVARALVSGQGNTATGTKAFLALAEKDLVAQKKINEELAIAIATLKKLRVDDFAIIESKDKQIADFTKRLVEANNKLLKQQDGSPEEYKRKMEFYKSMAQEWKKKINHA